MFAGRRNETLAAGEDIRLRMEVRNDGAGSARETAMLVSAWCVGCSAVEPELTHVLRVDTPGPAV